jgi:F-box domain
MAEAADREQGPDAIQNASVSGADGSNETKNAFEICLQELQEEIERLVKTNATCTCHIWYKAASVANDAGLPSRPKDSEAIAQITDNNKASNKEARKADVATELTSAISINDSKTAVQNSIEADSDVVANELSVNGGSDTVPASKDLLCLYKFFHRFCKSFHDSNQSECPFQNSNLTIKTLHEVISASRRGTSQLTTSERFAMAKWSDKGSMPMLQYTMIEIKSDCGNFLNLIITALAQQGTSTFDVAYMVLDDNLAFDCYQEDGNGMTYYTQDFARKRAVQINTGANAGGDDYLMKYACFTLLPGQLLEYILTFLPETHVASISLVCKSWHVALAGGSEGFWKGAMEQRGWSHANRTRENDHELSMRQKFMNYFGPKFDATAVVESLVQLEKGNGREDFVRYRFRGRRGVPEYPNNCVGLYVWSPTEVLAAYSDDCSLLLFEYESNPYDKTKTCSMTIQLDFRPNDVFDQMHCEMLAMDVDDTYIGCLFVVNDYQMAVRNNVITMIPRDEFYTCRGGDFRDPDARIERPGTTMIQVGDVFLDYIKEHEGFEDITKGLQTFEDNRGFEWDINVDVPSNICACGGGNFMVEVMVFVPVLHHARGDIRSKDILGRRLVVFSATTESIVWAGASIPMYKYVVFDFRRVTMHSRKMGDKRVIAITNTGTNSMLIGNIYADTFDEGNTLTLKSFKGHQYKGCRSSNLMYHSVLVLNSCIVSAEFWMPRTRKEEVVSDKKLFSNRQLEQTKSTITIRTLKRGTEDSYTSTHVELPEQHDAYRVVDLKDNYIGVFCVDRTDPQHEGERKSTSDLDDDGKANVKEMYQAIVREAKRRRDTGASPIEGYRSSRVDEHSEEEAASDSEARFDPMRFLTKDEATAIGRENLYHGPFAVDDDRDGDWFNLALMVYHIPSGRFVEKYKSRRYHHYSPSTIPLVARSGGTIASTVYCYGVAMTGPNIYGKM